MQNVFNKEEGEWIFEHVELCDKNMLSVVEQKYLDVNLTCKECMNIQPIAGVANTLPRTQETKEKIRKALSGRTRPESVKLAVSNANKGKIGWSKGLKCPGFGFPRGVKRSRSVSVASILGRLSAGNIKHISRCTFTKNDIFDILSSTVKDDIKDIAINLLQYN